MFNPWDDRNILKIYGPYKVKIKKYWRRLVIIRFSDKTCTSMSYARWLMIQHLQRNLTSEEHVDHIDENPLNDVITNLQILTPGDNNRKSWKGKPSPLKGIEKGWKHGTFYAWMKKKCTCKICVKAKQEWSIERNRKRRKGSLG